MTNSTAQHKDRLNCLNAWAFETREMEIILVPRYYVNMPIVPFINLIA